MGFRSIEGAGGEGNANVEYTVKIQFVALKKQTNVWILLCFNFLEILSFFFCIFYLIFSKKKKKSCAAG